MSAHDPQLGAPATRPVVAALERALSRVPDWFSDSPDMDRLLRIEDDLRLYVELGVLGEDEAGVWRSRVARVREACLVPRSQLRADASRAACEQMLEERFGAFAHPTDGDEALGPLGSLQEAIAAMRAIGLISEAEADVWSERTMAEILGRRSSAQPVPAQTCEAPPGHGRQLQRSVAWGGQRIAGSMLTCIELYDDCVIVRWHRVLSDEQIEAAIADHRQARDRETGAAVARRWAPPFDLHDDVGTEYHAPQPPSLKTATGREVGGDDAHPVWGTSTFFPGVPPHARTLDAQHAGEHHVIDLLTS